MHTKLYISLKERGSPQVVSRDEWLRAGCSTDAMALARLGAVKISPAGSFLLVEPKTLVGVFDSPRLKLEIAPKSSIFVTDLLARLDGWRRNVNLEDPSRNGTFSISASMWSTLEGLLSDLHREGLPWIYAREITTSSTPRGRLLFRETATRLLSKGISHQVVSSSQVRRHFDSLAPALDAVRRRIALVEAGQPTTRSKVLRLIQLTGDLSLPVSDVKAKATFSELAGLEARPLLNKLCSYCIQVLEGSDSSRKSQRIGAGIAEFVDLEKLWENAIHMLLEQHMYSDANRNAVLHPLRRTGLTLFNDGGPEIDPDIVGYANAKQYAVVDAKYSVTSSPAAGDVYQLNSYVSRLKCAVGILAYVADGTETSICKIGTLDGGQQLFACYLALDAFKPGNTALSEIFPVTSVTA